MKTPMKMLKLHPRPRKPLNAQTSTAPQPAPSAQTPADPAETKLPTISVDQEQVGRLAGKLWRALAEVQEDFNQITLGAALDQVRFEFLTNRARAFPEVRTQLLTRMGLEPRDL